jgi:hypothetical protein
MHQVRWGTITTVEFTVSGGDLLGYILLFVGWLVLSWSRFLGVVVSPVDVVCFLFCVGKSTSKIAQMNIVCVHVCVII